MPQRPSNRPQTPELIIDPVELGDRLRAKRRSEGMSIREVAHEIGVSAPTLSRVERGQHLPERENLLRIARWAGVRIDPVLHPDETEVRRNQLVHSPDASTVEAVEMHLRADKNLSRADAEALSEIFRVAYEAVSGKRSGKKKGEAR
jgi:transcriptional regulator with XRE-family HTH domain